MTADITPENVAARALANGAFTPWEIAATMILLEAEREDRAEAAEAENVKLRNEVRLRKGFVEEAIDERDAAEAREAKLRDALRRIAETSNYTRAEWMQDTARAALHENKT